MAKSKPYLPKIGFCDTMQVKQDKAMPNFTTKVPDPEHVKTMSRKEAAIHLQMMAEHNIRALNETVDALIQQDARRRMFRINGNILPVYANDLDAIAYIDEGFIRTLERQLGSIGKKAREHGVRLSMNLDNFAVLGSGSFDIMFRSIRAMEFRANIAEWLGYEGGKVDDFAIITTPGPKQKRDRWHKIVSRLSQRSQRYITFENGQIYWSPDNTLKLCQETNTRMVVNLYNEWVRSGSWIIPTTGGAPMVRDLWAPFCAPMASFSMPAPSRLGVKAKDKIYNARWLPERGDHPLSMLQEKANYAWSIDVLYHLQRWMVAGFDIQLDFAQTNLVAEPVADWFNPH